MLATNPVLPRQLTPIRFVGTPGPSEPWPRRFGRPTFPFARLLGLGVSLLPMRISFGSIDTTTVTAAATPEAEAAPAEPGADERQGVVVRLGVEQHFPGDFRIGPGGR